MAADSPTVRLDRWLWAARFFKTRTAATDAVDGGKVQVNGVAVKPSRPIRIGDEIRIHLGPFEHVLAVEALGERRGSAAAARSLYTERPESIAARERLREQHRIAPAAFVYEDKGRPTKKDRRELQRFIDRKRGR